MLNSIECATNLEDFATQVILFQELVEAQWQRISEQSFLGRLFFLGDTETTQKLITDSVELSATLHAILNKIENQIDFHGDKKKQRMLKEHIIIPKLDLGKLASHLNYNLIQNKVISQFNENKYN